MNVFRSFFTIARLSCTLRYSCNPLVRTSNFAHAGFMLPIARSYHDEEKYSAKNNFGIPPRVDRPSRDFNDGFGGDGDFDAVAGREKALKADAIERQKMKNVGLQNSFCSTFFTN